MGAGGAFVLTTVLMHQLPDAALVGIAAALPAVVALSFAGPTGARSIIEGSRRRAISAAAGGVLAFWAAPLLVLTRRATDAPPGTEALFFATAAWAVPLVIVGYRTKDSHTPMPAAGMTAAVAGAAALLASWERPSSFSPFVRFPEQELVMLAAGVLFAVGCALIAAAMRGHERRDVAVISLGSAAAIGLVGAVVSMPSWEAVAALGVPLVLLGGAHAVFGIGIHGAIERRGVNGVAASLALAPAAVTALAAVERATSVFGANPIGWPAASAAILVSAAGAAVLLASPRAVGPVQAPLVATRLVDRLRAANRVGKLAASLAAIALVSGAISLVTPALSAVSRGIAEGAAFRAEWAVLGIESAPGWIAFSAALLAAAAVIAALGQTGRWAVRVTAIASLVVAAACWFLRHTPFYTVTRWIPAEVQQAYGTEYARITFEALFDPLRVAALVAAAVAATLVLARGSLVAPIHEDEEV